MEQDGGGARDLYVVCWMAGNDAVRSGYDALFVCMTWRRGVPGVRGAAVLCAVLCCVVMNLVGCERKVVLR